MAHFHVVCHARRIIHFRMLKIKNVIGLGLFWFLVTIGSASAVDDAQELYDRSYEDFMPFDRRIQYLIEAKRSVSGIKNLIDELHNRLEKRTACALDGGLSASCNHKDAVEAGEHHRFLASSFAPGRRKRRSLRVFDKENIFKE